MKFNQWTLALAAAGVVSLGSVAFAEETQHQVMTALQSTTLSGYVDTSAIWKIGGTGNRLSGRSFDGTAKQNGINLNVVNLTLEKPLDEGQWSAGYKAELLFGPDADTFGANSVVGAGNASDFAIKQAYVNLRAPIGNGLDFEMGVFDNILGYETFNSYANPNYSRSYAYAIEPLQHTGILASYRFTEWLKISGGIAETWSGAINERAWRSNPVIGNNTAKSSELTYLSLIELTAPESLGFLKDAKLYAGIDDGLNGRFSNRTSSDITSYYVGATVPTPLQGLAVGAAYDYRGTKQNGPNNAIGTVPSSYANAISLYASYKCSDKLSFANRTEYASGTSGVWTGFKPAGGEEFFGETLTMDYRPWGPNVITRLEGRWDHDLSARRGAAAAFGNNVGAGAIGDKNALSIALNVIYKF